MMPDPWYRCALSELLIVLALPALPVRSIVDLTVLLHPRGQLTHSSSRPYMALSAPSGAGLFLTSAPIAKALLDAHSAASRSR